MTTKKMVCVKGEDFVLTLFESVANAKPLESKWKVVKELTIPIDKAIKILEAQLQ